MNVFVMLIILHDMHVAVKCFICFEDAQSIQMQFSFPRVSVRSVLLFNTLNML